MTGGPEQEGDPAWPEGRRSLWLPLLRQLDRTVPEWVVLKNLDSAFDGIGDVDTMAPPRTWPAIEAAFRSWAAASGLTVVGVCRHNRRGPNLLARRDGDPYLFILDVKATRPWRFATLIRWDQARSFAVHDADGYRRVRDGAGATLKLLFNGTGYGGASRETAMVAKGVREELRADPAGALAAADLVGLAAPALRRGIRAALAGGWSRGDMLAVEAWSIGRAVLHPMALARQIRQRRTWADRCPALWLSHRAGRRLPDDVGTWLREFEAAHPTSPGVAAQGAAA